MKFTQVTLDQKERFSQFLQQSPYGHFLQTWEWGEVKAKTGWEPLRYMVEEEGRILCAVSLLKRKLPLVNGYILYAPRGPVFDLKDEKLLDFFLREVKRVAKKEKAIFLKIDPAIEDQDCGRILRNKGFLNAERGKNFEGIQPRFVMRLPLEATLEEILAGFHHKTRYNIRIAERKGVEIRIAESKEELKDWYEVLLETAERDNFLVRSSKYFEEIWDQMKEPGLTRLFLAYYEGEMIAGTLAFLHGDTAWYLYGASSNRHRQVMPNYLLQWEMIKWAKEEGCTLYDFRGVSGDMDPSNPLYGLYRFKKGFNPELVEFIGEYDLAFSPLLYHLYNYAEPRYRYYRGKLLNRG